MRTIAIHVPYRVLRTVLQRVASEGDSVRSSLERATNFSPRKFVEPHARAAHDLTDHRLNLAAAGGVGVLHRQILASLRRPLASRVVGVVALVDGILERVDLPAILEITVPGESRRVSANEGSAALLSATARGRANIPGGIDKRPTIRLLPAPSKGVNVPGDLR